LTGDRFPLHIITGRVMETGHPSTQAVNSGSRKLLFILPFHERQKAESNYDYKE